MGLAQSHLLNSQGKKIDTAKCLLNGSRVLLAAWRTAQPACSAVAACPARSTPRRRAWTSPASSACCSAAACPGSPPGSSGGKPGRNTGLKEMIWTTFSALAAALPSSSARWLPRLLREKDPLKHGTYGTTLSYLVEKENDIDL